METCSYCKKEFEPKRNYTYNHKTNPDWNKFCSFECQGTLRSKQQIVKCLVCQVEFKKSAAEIKKSNNHFCCRSHSATYWNKHKTKGYRRSKLEVYLEKEIKKEFPDIPILPNDNSLGFELDLYFPTLRLAFELNGIVHYEPIYGVNKFEKIQKMMNKKECDV